jgi:hypothetical protein
VKFRTNLKFTGRNISNSENIFARKTSCRLVTLVLMQLHLHEFLQEIHIPQPAKRYKSYNIRKY